MIMSVSATSENEAAAALPSIDAHRVGNGLVVRLSGVLDGQAVPALRRELLAPLPNACRDVFIDAGTVTALDDEALAVLVAGSSWARSTGARFAFSAASTPVLLQIDALDLDAVLPVLGSGT